ncbi:MAG: amidohydrolase family protein [Chloroflexi bacterium]|nr:amidohydrolase family protein [Chloroflexota bacterium]
MFILEPSLDDVAGLIKVSRGAEPADLYIRGGTVANVYSGEYLPSNVAVSKGRIAYVGLSEASIGADTQVIDASGKYVCPGYVEVHAHPWANYNPVELCRAMLPVGTTTAFFDTLVFLLLLGNEEMERILDDLRGLPVKVFWNPRIAPQSVMVDEDVKFALDRIRRLLERPDAAGTFEVTRWPEIVAGDRRYLELIDAARKLGKRVDAHTAGASYEKLNPLVAAGVESCHEAIDLQQALDRLRLGMWVFLRDSSLREDLGELIRIVTENKVCTSRLVLTTDGPTPTYFVDKGSVEYLADLAVKKGVDPMTALQMITLNPATYFHLDQYIGGIAPGRIADIVINPRPDRFKPETVITNGQLAARDGIALVEFPNVNWEQYGFDGPKLPPGVRIRPEHVMVRAEDAVPTFPIMDLVSAAITRRRDVELPVSDGFVDLSENDGLLFISLLDRHGKWTTNGVIKGFARKLEGFATSYNTACHVLVMGTNGEAMAMAANRLYEIGGGIVLVEKGRVLFEQRLEIGGEMSSEHFQVTVDRTRELLGLFREGGHAYEDLPYTILFLSCDFLPEIRVTLAGVFDVKNRQTLRPPREIR